MTIEWHDVAGFIGVVLVLLAYFLLQLGRMQSNAIVFSAINAVGSALIILSLLQSFNLSAFVIEVCWLLISLYGVTISTLARTREQSRS